VVACALFKVVEIPELEKGVDLRRNRVQVLRLSLYTENKNGLQ
jgi:hypothetical protein